MIDCIFQQQGKYQGVRIEGYNLTFITQQGNFWKAAPLKNLKFEISTILKEFPDLKDKRPEEIKEIALKRFEEKIRKYKSEMEIKDYVKEDLKKYGFRFIGYRRKGFRFMKDGSK